MLLAVFALLVACGETAVPATTPTSIPVTDTPAAINQQLYEFAKHGVDVAVFVQRHMDGTLQLTADFVPEEANMHVYGMTLPRQGIEGVGRPTLLEVISGDLVVSGALSANVEAADHSFPGFVRPFPLYPDGPVTLSLPVSLGEDADLDAVELSFTYMACSSEGVCKPPVTDHRFTVDLSNIAN